MNESMNEWREDDSDFIINIPAAGPPKDSDRHWAVFLLVRTEQRGESLGLCVVCPSALSVLTETTRKWTHRCQSRVRVRTWRAESGRVNLAEFYRHNAQITSHLGTLVSGLQAGPGTGRVRSGGPEQQPGGRGGGPWTEDRDRESQEGSV